MKYWPQYLAMLEDLQNGSYENAARELHLWREKLNDHFNLDLEWMRRLLAARLALKTNRESVSQELFVGDLAKLSEPLKAEIFFVRGLAHFERAEFSEGVRSFENAIPLYRSLGNAYREILSSFNAIAGAECAGEIDEQLEISKLVALGFRARALATQDPRCERFAFAAEREKSFLAQREGNLAAAQNSISKARTYYEQFGPLSDLHICLLQEADIALDQKNSGLALSTYQLVREPVDPRVSFPKAYIAWRLGLGEKPIPSEYLMVPTWQKKIQKPTQIKTRSIWDLSSSSLSIDGNQYFLKADSLEAKLLSLLAESRRSKELLCTSLWPEYAESAHIENRLHRLISRLNKKIPQLIQWTGGYYSLRQPKANAS